MVGSGGETRDSDWEVFMVSYFSVVVCLFLLSVSLFAQSSAESNSVRLVGKAESLRLIRTKGSKTARLEVNLKLSLINDGSREILFLKMIDGREFPEFRGLSIFDGDMKSKPVVKDHFGESYGRSEVHEQIAASLNTQKPTAAIIRSLPSGASFDFERTIVVWLKADESNSSEFPAKPTIGALSQLSDLKLSVVFSMWSKNIDLNSGVEDFRDVLRKRWLPNSYLFTDSVISESITIDLRSVEKVIQSDDL